MNVLNIIKQNDTNCYNPSTICMGILIWIY